MTRHISNRRERARGPIISANVFRWTAEPPAAVYSIMAPVTSGSGRLLVAISVLRLLQRLVMMDVTVSFHPLRYAMPRPDRRAEAPAHRARHGKRLCRWRPTWRRNRRECDREDFDNRRRLLHVLFPTERGGRLLPDASCRSRVRPAVKRPGRSTSRDIRARSCGLASTLCRGPAGPPDYLAGR